MRKVLFVAEAATLAHVARPLALAMGLDRKRFFPVFACAARNHGLLRDFPGPVHPLDSISSEQFRQALDLGKPLYDAPTLERYVCDDLALFERVRPDLVVGDFRLSMSVSARLAGLPYVAISNCYWSPYWQPARFPVPKLPLTRYLPLPLADLLFRIARPLAFALHARPLNRVRQQHGLASLGKDLRRIYTDADQVVYADLPALFASARLPATHHFIGAVSWSPPAEPPDWWDSLDEARPLVYLTLGSSGDARLLPQALEALAGLEVTVLASTAGAQLPASVPANARVATWLPGARAAARASLVICNGGSPTTQQALEAGVPVLGIASNLDQFLNMDVIRRQGAGEALRADRFNAACLRHSVHNLIASASHRMAAKQIALQFAKYRAPERFASLLDAPLPQPP